MTLAAPVPIAGAALRWHNRISQGSTSLSVQKPGKCVRHGISTALHESSPPIPHRHSWAAPAGAPGSLPVFLTSFVGRQEEIALASALLRRPDLRLLTLTGPGGIGKTRFATEIAATSAETFPDGIRFVPLASVQNQGMVM